jgi:hypothetical protein
MHSPVYWCHYDDPAYTECVLRVLLCHLERIGGWVRGPFVPPSVSPVAVVSAYRMIPNNSPSSPYRIFVITVWYVPDCHTRVCYLGCVMFCWPCIVVYQYSKTNVMHFLTNLLKIKGLYMFRAWYIKCVICQLAAVNWHNTHAIYQVSFVKRLLKMSK